MATFLDAVNNVFRRLREPAVTSVTDSDYAAMLGVFVNDAKREVEDAHEWNALASTITVTTSATVFNYTLTGSQQRFRAKDVLNTTSLVPMEYMTTQWAARQYMLTPTQTGQPTYYNFNGVAANGDTKVDLFPVPNGVFSIQFKLTIPQVDLVLGTDTIAVPYHLVAMLAYAKAIAERGEDAGVSGSEAYLMYKLALADAIAIERNRYEEQVTWVGV